MHSKSINLNSTCSLVITLVLLAMLSFHSVQAGQQDEPARETEMQRAEASGAPLALADLRPEPEEGSINAAEILQPVRQNWIDADMAVIDLFDFEGGELSPGFLEAWKGVEADRQKVAEAVAKAVEADVWIPDFNYDAPTSQEFVQQIQDQSVDLRSLARVLMYEAHYQVQQGESDEAARTSIRALQLVRLYPRLGLIGGTASNAVQQISLTALAHVLARADDLDLDTHQMIDNELKLHDSLESLRDCLISERAIGLQMLRDQGVVGLARAESYLRAMRSAIELADQTIGQQRRLLDPGEHGLTGGMIDPALNMTRDSSNRVLALTRCLRIANQIRSTMVNSLDVEEVDLPEESKQDPFTDELLIVRETGDGFIVYSRGSNRQDDGGDIAIVRDVGFEFQDSVD